MIIVWIVCVVAAYFLFYYAEKHIQYKDSEEELKNQTQVITNQIQSIVQNDQYSNVEGRMLFSKLKTLSFALENYPEIGQARDFLNQYAEAADVSALSIYDRQGKVLYHFSSEAPKALKQDEISKILDDNYYLQVADALDSVYEAGDEDFDFSSASLTPFELNAYWGAGDNRWLIRMEGKVSDELKVLEDYLHWTRVLQSYMVGKSGSVLALDEKDGTVLSYKDMSKRGASMEDLRIWATKGRDIFNIFRESGKTDEIEVEGIRYLACRLDVKNAFILAMIPMEEIMNDVYSFAGILTFLFVTFSGLCVFYSFFHIQESTKEQLEENGKRVWNRSLFNRLWVYTILATIGLVVVTFYIDYTTYYSRIVQFCDSRTAFAASQATQNEFLLGEAKVWFNNEYLTKGKIAKCVIENTDREQLDKDYLRTLSEKLETERIYIFNASGKIVLTDSDYDRLEIYRDSPFHVLLEGRPYLVQPYEKEALSGEILQQVGVSMRDRNDNSNGFVMIVVKPRELISFDNGLGAETLLKQTNLLDNTLGLLVDDNTMNVLFNTQVIGSTYINGINSNDYTGLSIQLLELDDTKLLDNYIGKISMLNKINYVSVRKADHVYYLVLVPSSGKEFIHILPLAISLICSLVFYAALLLISCFFRRQPELPLETSKETAGALKGGEEQKKNSIGVFQSILDKKKPYFETRWPKDCVRWRDKTAAEKFSGISYWILILSVAAIIGYMLLGGRNSVWYYSFNGIQEKGFNIYSINVCALTIYILFVTKFLLHKILFFIARAVNARGETICCLLDSFQGYILCIIGVFVCLSELGVPLMTLTLTGGVAGVIFGIGCQNTVADILAGILMTLEGIVHVGDLIIYNGEIGVIENIGVRTTRLNWFNEVRIVRNNELKNFTSVPSVMRIKLYMFLSLKNNLAHVEAAIKEALPRICDKISAEIGCEITGLKYRGVDKLTETSMRLSFNYFCRGEKARKVLRALNRELKILCDQNNITLGMELNTAITENAAGGTMLTDKTAEIAET